MPDSPTARPGATKLPDGRTVCYVTQWFPPEAVVVPLSIARALEARGWNVSVLTGMPNYPDGITQPGYGGIKPRNDQVHGLPTRRTPLYAYHGRSAVKRMLNYFSWALSATAFGRPAFKRADVSLVYSSPATAALPAMVAKLLSRIPYVLIIQDLWPDSVFAAGFLTKGHAATRATNAILAFLVNRTYAQASHIVVISPSMLDLLTSRGVPRDKISLIYNWVDEEIYFPRRSNRKLRDLLKLSDDAYTILYAGNHGAAQGLDKVIEAMSLIPAERNCHAVLLGDGVDKTALQKLAASVAPERTHFLDSLPPTKVAELMTSADSQLISLIDEPLFHHTMPSKVQCNLASGAISVVAAPGDAATVIADAGAGFVATPGDPQSIADAIMRAQDASPEMRKLTAQRARRLYDETMSAAIGSANLTDVLATVISLSAAVSSPNRRAADRTKG